MSDSERTIRCLPLHSLIPSPHNVRKTPAEGAAFEQLKASIAAHGLLESFLVQPARGNGEADARHEVVARFGVAERTVEQRSHFRVPRASSSKATGLTVVRRLWPQWADSHKFKSRNDMSDSKRKREPIVRERRSSVPSRKRIPAPDSEPLNVSDTRVPERPRRPKKKE